MIQATIQVWLPSIRQTRQGRSTQTTTVTCSENSRNWKLTNHSPVKENPSIVRTNSDHKSWRISLLWWSIDLIEDYRSITTRKPASTPEHGPVSPQDHFNQWWPADRRGRNDEPERIKTNFSSACGEEEEQREQYLQEIGEKHTQGGELSGESLWSEARISSIRQALVLAGRENRQRRLMMIINLFNPLIIPSHPPLKQKAKAESLKVAHFFFLDDSAWCLT